MRGNPRLAMLLLVVAGAGVAGCGGIGSGDVQTPNTATVVVETVEQGTTTLLPVAANIVVGGIRGTVDMTQHWVILSGIPLDSDNQQPLTATAPGYVTVTQTVQLSPFSYTTVTVEMARADINQTATVQGRVTNGDSGAGVANALVTFIPSVGSPVSGYTDSTGLYVIGGIVAGPAEVTVKAMGYLEGTATTALMDDASGTNDPVNIALVSGSTKVTVTGRVLRMGPETPVGGAEVTLAQLNPVTTDAQGNFTVTEVPVGQQTVVATAPGYDTRTLTAEITPTMGPLIIYLPPTSPGPPPAPYTISGVVTLMGKSDNSGATVTATDKATGQMAGSSTTDAAGNYYLFVPPGTYRLTVSYGTHSVSQSVTLLGGGRTLTGVNFTLAVTPTVSGLSVSQRIRVVGK